MKASELKHGDILLYEEGRQATTASRLIRLVTGSKFTHVSIVQEIYRIKFVLEQLGERTHSYVPLYYVAPGEVVHCVRPKFTPVKATVKIFERKPYGYWSICDVAINHFIGLFNKNWVYRPWFMRWVKNPNIDCSILVGEALNLKDEASWCNHLGVLEPDDFYNHTETFEYLGVVETWSETK